MGKQGNKVRAQSKPEIMQKGKQSKDILDKWTLPKSKAKGRKIYQIPANHDRVLWISDIHFPNHDVKALTTALDYGIEHNANCIVIGGDLLDNAPFTRFTVPPSAKFAREVFDETVKFLNTLRRNFPDAHIVFMQGNHDKWYEQWLMTKCAEVFDDPYYQLEARLELDKLGIVYQPENVIVKAGKLPMLHGHTIVRGVFAPVNSARGAYIKSNHNLLIGHTHQVSVHSAKDLMGRPTKTWSTGCLCTLNPDYDPHNIRHTHGFAFITTEKNGEFTVRNIEIVNGKIR
jgi:predicted phosphodiesterase